MNVRCKEIQPFLFRVNEGEATPEQAMQVARHLSDCTACRITRAREKRLAEMLDSDLSELDELPVGEDFVDAVMGTLPQELPKRKPGESTKKWGGLKLASFGGFVGLLALQGAPDLSGSMRIPAQVLPLLSADGSLTIPDGVLGLARVATSVAGALTSGAQLEAQGLAVGVGFLAATALTGVLALAGTSAVVALAARSLLRQP